MGLEVGDNEITPDVVLYRRKIAGYLVTFQQLLQNIADNPANEPVRLRIPTQLVYHTGDIDTLAARLVGMPRPTLHAKMQKYGLRTGRDPGMG